jgi:hypothetical protein
MAAQLEAQKFQDQQFNFGLGSGSVTGSGSTFNFNQPTQAQLSQLLASQQGLLGGGLFNDPMIQAGLMQADFGGAMSQANQALMQQAGGTAFGQLGNLAQTAGGLGGQLALQTALGPQDLSGGAQGALLQGGLGNILAAGNTGALGAQATDLLRQQAQGSGLLDQAINKLQNRQFAQGRLGSTGGAQESRQFLDAVSQQDLGFQLAGQQLAQQEAGRLGQLGLGQIGQGAGLLGQNLAGFGQTAGLAGQFLGQAGGFEGQQFGQSLQGLQQNQAAGLNRLQAAQGALGFGSDLFAQQAGLGLAAGGQALDINKLAVDQVLGLRGTEASRISGAGGSGFGQTFSQPSGTGGFVAGLGSALGKGFDQIFRKPTPQRFFNAPDASGLSTINTGQINDLRRF